MGELSIPYPPRDIFEKDETPISQVISETQYVNIIEKIDYPESGGILVYLRDALYPSKGFPTPEAMLAVNLAKRFLIGQILTIMRSDLKYFLALSIFLPWERKMRIFRTWVYNYNDLAMKVLRPYLMKVERMTPLGQETYSIIKSVLTNLNVGTRKVENFSRIFSSLIDYDTAYRYRIEDLMSETTKEELLKKPIREIRRLLKLLVERDSRTNLQDKFNAVGYAVAVALLIPRIRKAFKKAISECSFSNLQLDEADRYHALRLDGYKFMGRSIEDRWAEYLKLHNGKPPALYELKGGKVAPHNG